MKQDNLKRMTNEEFVIYLMNFSSTGALVQSFVIEALRVYAEKVTENGEPEDDGKSIVNPKAWYKTGVEVLEKVNLKYKS